MDSIASLYAFTSVTLHGTVMLIPVVNFNKETYPFDLHIFLPEFIFAKKIINPFLKFLHFINFHYKGMLTISSLIRIKSEALLDQLYATYLRSWNENAQITVLPERRLLVEQQLVNWCNSLPKTFLSEFMQQYYSNSLKNTDWIRKKTLWRSLRHAGTKLRKSRKSSETILDKYVEIWFSYMDKIEFSRGVQSKFPEFIKAMNNLTFKQILEDLRICPACETELSDYPESINYCPFCGSSLKKREQASLQTESKFCANCGASLREGTLFCSNCGSKIKNPIY